MKESRAFPRQDRAASAAPNGRPEFPVRKLEVSAYRIPTATPLESDGTLQWNKTVLVVVQIHAGNAVGLGYTYGDRSAVELIRDTLAEPVISRDALDIPRIWQDMIRRVRNLGRPGIASTAISSVDNALWDLKAKLLGLPLVKLLGQFKDEIPIYGSGGFTSYSIAQLQHQLAGWVEQGIPRVKMKVGRDPSADTLRVEAARKAIGSRAELFVDANGAYDRKRALWMARIFAELGVSWFEEPVSSDDLNGLRLLRDRAPAGMDIAAGEYGYDTPYFERMLRAGAVDVLQIDGTRCLGISGFLEAAGLCAGHLIPLSAHTAPAIHAHVCCAIPHTRHLEYFFDHARIENAFFEGALGPVSGALRPDLSRHGIGLTLRRSQAEKFAA